MRVGETQRRRLRVWKPVFASPRNSECLRERNPVTDILLPSLNCRRGLRPLGPGRGPLCPLGLLRAGIGALAWLSAQGPHGLAGGVDLVRPPELRPRLMAEEPLLRGQQPRGPAPQVQFPRLSHRGGHGCAWQGRGGGCAGIFAPALCHPSEGAQRGPGTLGTASGLEGREQVHCPSNPSDHTLPGPTPRPLLRLGGEEALAHVFQAPQTPGRGEHHRVPLPLHPWALSHPPQPVRLPPEAPAQEGRPPPGCLPLVCPQRCADAAGRASPKATLGWEIHVVSQFQRRPRASDPRQAA